jgi:cell fate regulator YaaT (PSP1 superfamily)
MITAVGITFRRAGKVYWFDPEGLELRRGQMVVVETAGGQELGKVKAEPEEISEEGLTLPLKPILRAATPEDLRREDDNRLREQECFAIAEEKIVQHGLPMKLVGVESLFDRSRMTFHFVAESRVDFRELAKDLARACHCRVELHQVGVRDETKIIGGLGPCGRELCCAAFLSDFEPVAIKMAKEQDLSLNPQKISGVCGRLMCCLAYEYCSYREVKKGFPRVGSKITTPKGVGKITGIDVPREEAIIALEEGGTVRLSAEEVSGCNCEVCPRKKNEGPREEDKTN